MKTEQSKVKDFTLYSLRFTAEKIRDIFLHRDLEACFIASFIPRDDRAFFIDANDYIFLGSSSWFNTDTDFYQLLEDCHFRGIENTTWLWIHRVYERRIPEFKKFLRNSPYCKGIVDQMPAVLACGLVHY